MWLRRLQVDDLTINFNFSELKACVCLEGQLQNSLLTSWFRFHMVTKDELEEEITSPAKKARRTKMELAQSNARCSSDLQEF